MIRPTVLCATVLLAACAGQQLTDTSKVEEAVRDYIEVHQLPEVDKLRSSRFDHWTEIDRNFLVYETRDEVFLVEFGRACYQLDETPVVADIRHDQDTVYARFDTIRGCRISKLYAVTENDVAELTALGESTDSDK
jgi:hypothetical protein